MKKVLFLAMAAMLIFTNAALAAPLDDYKAGNIAASVWLRKSDYVMEALGEGSIGGIDKNGFAFGLTGAVADKLAVEFSYGGNDKRSIYDFMNVKYTDYDVKLKYMAFKDSKIAFMPYLGLAYDRLRLDTGFGDSMKMKKTQAIIGVTGVVALHDKFKGYADLGVGTKLLAWKLGLSCEVAPHLELDLGYSWRKSKFVADFFGQETDIKLTKKGFFLGLTYNFR